MPREELGQRSVAASQFRTAVAAQRLELFERRHGDYLNGQRPGVPRPFWLSADGREGQGLGIDRLPRDGCKRSGEPNVVEGRLARARRRVDRDEASADTVAQRVPETGAPVDPVRPDLVADHELARARRSPKQPLGDLVVLRAVTR